ncbi:hypothetical protein ICW40_04720 [Actinotalea ferrariae]|uniref:hypothetical protein n=1 Tax=Actinotalea ferrariae TaxID=1386098 RepID=UPI001C8CD811|nr:hypothetical protein [Actinotalea ferrariae]MBX9244110.1 hypothetical protein [Actinotalea ferrariae]
MRDIVAATLEGRWIDTGIIAVSFVPAVGDIAGAAAKFAKALPRMAEPAAAAARRWLMNLWSYADDAGMAGHRSIDDVVADFRPAYPDVVSRLENPDIPAERIAAILNKNLPARIQNYPVLADEGKVILRFDYPNENLRPGSYFSGRSAENWIREVIGSSPRPSMQTFPDFVHNGRTLGHVGRVHDAAYRVGVRNVLVEIKMGVGARSGRQIAMDASLLRTVCLCSGTT